MNAPIEFFRFGITGESLNYYSIFYSILCSSILLIAGIIYFRKTESYFADLA
jgi:hypothetical protein